MQKARVWLKPSTIFGNSRWLKFAPSEPLAVRKQPKCASCDTVLFWARLKAVLYIVIASWKSNARENSHWISAFGVLGLFLVGMYTARNHHSFQTQRIQVCAAQAGVSGRPWRWPWASKKLKDQHLLTYCSKFSIFSWWHSRLKHSNDWSGNILKVKWKWKHQSIGVYRVSGCFSTFKPPMSAVPRPRSSNRLWNVSAARRRARNEKRRCTGKPMADAPGFWKCEHQTKSWRKRSIKSRFMGCVHMWSLYSTE